MSRSDVDNKAPVQLEAALYAATKYALITVAERDGIRARFAELSEPEKQAALDGHLERPFAQLTHEKRERLILLLHRVLSSTSRHQPN